ncbi:hypothetical protein P171DRAFT_340237, partial [Karstenula rhodostoma CBS 690.94]
IITTASVSTALPSAKPKPVKSQDIINALAGTYTLVNTSSTLNNVPVPDATYGEAPVGILTYSKSGYVSATISATEPAFRPNVAFPYQDSDLDSDWALVGKHTIGYAGPFRVNEALPANKTHGQVFHGPLVVANVPTLMGKEQKRNYTVVRKGGETLLRIGSDRGGGYKGVLWWKKV